MSEQVEHVDALIVGTGQAGKPLAGALAEAGWRTVIVERDRVGGTCVVRGCTPTKTMVASARVAHLVRRASDYGIDVADARVDLARVRERKREIVDSWVESSRKGMQRHDTLELVMGDARFSGVRALDVALDDGGVRRFSADHVVLNVGARNVVPGIDGLDRVDWLDSTSIMELDEVPGHLVVLGGGFIGIEFAQMFRRFGADVTILEQRRLLAREDVDVSEGVRDILEDDGITVMEDARVVGVDAPAPGKVSVRVEAGASGEGGEAVEGTHLLLAVGIRPNTDTLRCELAGVELTDRGHVRVDDRLRTSAEGVWAVGDVTGAPPFTHMAYDDYRILEANLLGDGAGSRDGRLLVYTMFTDPQLGRVGMTEAEAEEEGRAVRVAKLPMSRVARAIEMDETRGFMKAIVDAESDRILGAAILGVEGGEVAAVLQMAMLGDLPWTVLRDTPIAHPTLAESLNNLFASLDA